MSGLSRELNTDSVSPLPSQAPLSQPPPLFLSNASSSQPINPATSSSSFDGRPSINLNPSMPDSSAPTTSRTITASEFGSVRSIPPVGVVPGTRPLNTGTRTLQSSPYPSSGVPGGDVTGGSPSPIPMRRISGGIPSYSITAGR